MANCKLVLATELTIKAPSQYLNYSFSSMVKFGNRYYGGNADGLFELESGDTDNGTYIDAHFKLFTTDFGSRNLKRMRAIFVRGLSDGQLLFTVEDDENNERTYPLENVKSTSTGQKVPVGRDGKGVYWSVKVANNEGSDFSINTLEALMLILKTTNTRA